jgi:hypothetical protein
VLPAGRYLPLPFAGAFSTARAALAFLASAASWSLMRFSSATLASLLLLHQLLHQPFLLHQQELFQPLFPWHPQEIEPLPLPLPHQI